MVTKQSGFSGLIKTTISLLWLTQIQQMKRDCFFLYRRSSIDSNILSTAKQTEITLTHSMFYFLIFFICKWSLILSWSQHWVYQASHAEQSCVLIYHMMHSSSSLSPCSSLTVSSFPPPLPDVIKLQLVEAGLVECLLDVVAQTVDGEREEDIAQLKTASDLMVLLLLGGKQEMNTQLHMLVNEVIDNK